MAMKKPTAKQKGLKKLPSAVRNKMGYMKGGGMTKMKKKGYAKGGAVKKMMGGGMAKKGFAKGGAIKKMRRGGKA